MIDRRLGESTVSVDLPGKWMFLHFLVGGLLIGFVAGMLAANAVL